MTETNLRGFFWFLRKNRISASNVGGRISSWSSSKLLDFIAEAYEHVLVEPVVPKSVFCFTASSDLSGAPFPCIGTECRLSKLDSLARFAALYADQVYIANPFERYITDNRLPETLEDETTSELVRMKLEGDILGLLYLRPLFEAGILSIRHSLVSVCSDCLVEAEALEGKVRNRLETAEKQLQRRYHKETQVKIMDWNGDPFLRITGPEYLVEHGSLDFFGRLPESLLNSHESGQTRKLTQHEVKELGIIDRFTRAIMEDIFDQNVHACLSGSQYLSDREVDLDVLKSIGGTKVVQTNDALVDGLAHSIPTIANVSVERLIKLRTKEGEAFEVYRDAVSRALKEAQTLDKEKIRELVADEIVPEVHKIERTIKISRRLVTESLTKDLVVSLGYITAGLFSGFLSPDAANLITALGGYNLAASVVDKIASLAIPSEKAQENAYYFLWKVSNLKESV